MTSPPPGAQDLAETLIKRVEGCVLHPYLDSGGVWTIGVGCTRLHDQAVTGRTSPITQDQADEALRYEMMQTRLLLSSVVRVLLKAGQWAALASFAFNVGGPRFSKSTLLRLLNAGDAQGASRQFVEWNLVGGKVDRGIINRRLLEQQVFDTGKLPPYQPMPIKPLQPVTVLADADTADELNARQLAAIQKGT